MFDNLLIITLFLLASLFVYLLTSRLSVNIKHCVLFFIRYDISGYCEIPTPTGLFWFIKFKKDLRAPVYFDPPPPFIKHLKYRFSYF